jgi:hypothetical protein
MTLCLEGKTSDERDVLSLKVAQVLVCDPRRNALLKEGKQERHDTGTQVGRLVTYGHAAARSIPENMEWPVAWPSQPWRSSAPGASSDGNTYCAIREGCEL